MNLLAKNKGESFFLRFTNNRKNANSCSENGRDSGNPDFPMRSLCEHLPMTDLYFNSYFGQRTADNQVFPTEFELQGEDIFCSTRISSRSIGFYIRDNSIHIHFAFYLSSYSCIHYNCIVKLGFDHENARVTRA